MPPLSSLILVGGNPANVALTDKDFAVVNSILQSHFPKDKKEFNARELAFILDEFKKYDPYLEHATTHNLSQPYKHLRNFIKFLLYRMTNNFDALLLCEGIKGSGKSNFAILCALIWCKLLDIKFDFKKNLCYTNEQVMHALDTLPPFSPIVCDEAVNFCVSEEWAKVENRELRKRLAQVRTKHFFFVLCFPMKITKVQTTYLDSFVNYWISIFYRGLGAVFIRDLNPANDSWRIKDFSTIGSYNEFSKPEQIKKLLEKHPNFWKLISIPKLPHKVYEKYLVYREKNVYHVGGADLLVSRDSATTALLVETLKDIMQKDGSVTMNRLLIHLRNEHDVDVTKKDIDKAIKENEEVLKKAFEKKVLLRVSEVDHKRAVREYLKQEIKKEATKDEVDDVAIT